MTNIVFFDLETQKLASEVGGWGHIDQMQLSVAVTYATDDSKYRHFTEDQASELVAELVRADLVVGTQVEHHGDVIHAAHLGQQFGVSGVVVPRPMQRLLVQRRGGDRVDLAREGQADRGDHGIIGRLTRPGIDSPRSHLKHLV